MKHTLLFLLLGALIGAASYHLYLRQEAGPGSTRTQLSAAANRTESAAASATDAIGNKLRDWKLTPADIKADLQKAGKVVRTQAKAAGEELSDARIIAVIKGKYALESDLSALAINIDCANGHVTLRGEAASAELIGKAIRLALETSGVIEVESLLTAPVTAAV